MQEVGRYGYQMIDDKRAGEVPGSLILWADGVYCFSYGVPSAAGGMARPTMPVSTIIVTM